MEEAAGLAREQARLLQRTQAVIEVDLSVQLETVPGGQGFGHMFGVLPELAERRITAS
jgi:hypothetical protein